MWSKANLACVQTSPPPSGKNRERRLNPDLKLWCDIINLKLRTKPPIKSLAWYNFHIIQGGKYGSSISSSWVKLNHLSRNRALQFPKIPLGNKVECQVLNSKCHSVECRGTFFLKLVTVNEHGDKGWNETCVNPFITQPAHGAHSI